MHVQWIILLCVVALLRTCTGSAWLQDPPSRSAAWYYQVQTPVNYNFRNLNCGNKPVCEMNLRYFSQLWQLSQTWHRLSHV